MGLNFKLDVSSFTMRSAGRFLSVIRDTFLNANAFDRVASAVKNFFAVPVLAPAYALTA